MRIKRALAIGATLVALTAVGACGSGDDKDTRGGDTDGGKSSATGSEQTADSSLPKASDMAAVQAFLNKYVSCQELSTGSPESSGYLEDEAKEPSWGIREWASCDDAEGSTITLFGIKNMRMFQASVKTNGNEAFLVGQDFAVAAESSSTTQQLKSSGLMTLTCDPDFTVPSGHKKESALVDGCLLTDYFPS